MKIKLELEITSRHHGEEVLEAVRVELRRRALQYVFDTIDNTRVDQVERLSHKDFHVSGDITLSE